MKLPSDVLTLIEEFCETSVLFKVSKNMFDATTYKHRKYIIEYNIHDYFIKPQHEKTRLIESLFCYKKEHSIGRIIIKVTSRISERLMLIMLN
jgi:hypothetical protein